MDDRRFDQLAKAISEAAGSRRDSLQIALGSAAAALLGFIGREEWAEAQRRRKNDRNKNNRNRRRNNKKTRICFCPDSTGANCEDRRLPKKKAQRQLKRNPDSYKGRCDECQAIDTECNVNRPGECCANNCCFDTTSSLGGVCPTNDANCCGLTTTGGYCTTSFPQCCGENACCRSGEVCCANVRVPTGYCCPSGSICDFNQFNGCAFPQDAEVETVVERVVGTSQPRGRSGNP
jgi:hypothetical protein